MKHLTPEEEKAFDEVTKGGFIYLKVRDFITTIKHNAIEKEREKAKKCTRGLCPDGCEICEDKDKILQHLTNQRP